MADRARSEINERSVDSCLFHWSAVCRAAQTDWDRKFSASIAVQSRRRNWRPSAKQLEIMRKMVTELFAFRRIDDEFDPIDREDMQ